MDGDNLLVNAEDFESHFVYSCKQLILQRINFVPASSPDKYLEQLKAKYIPLNTTKKKKKKSKSARMLPTTKQPEDTDSASCSKDGESSILSPKVTLFNKEDLALTWNNVRGVGPGLVNLGNTCFLNSVIQCLTYTPPLANYLLSGEHKKKCQQPVSGSCALCQLQDHVNRVLSASSGSVRPAPIIQHLKTLTKPFRIGRQEDAHEFLRYYVDSMQKSCLKGYSSKLDPHSKSTTLVHQLFGGYFRSQVKCLKCWNTSDTYDPLLDISVETKNCPTLGKALKKITKPDMLDGDNKYSCPKCKTLTVAQKKFTLHSLPTILTIQLKRFNYNNYYGTKISKHVSYPEYIDLRPYMSETQGPEEWYHLYAVLVHSGVSCHSGHYYCFVVAANGAWYCMNDTHVTQVRLDTVLSQEAYLLFYIKDTNYRSSSTASYTCTMVTEPADSSQETKTSSKLTPNKQLDSTGLSGSTNVANEIKSNNNTNKLKRIPKLIIRKKPLNKMVQTVDHNMVNDSSDNISMPKSSSASKLFTPRSVYSHAAMPNDSKTIESVSRKSKSPLSPPPGVKGNTLNYFMPASSRDAGVQVGESPVQSEQMKRQIAKVTPFPVSPPTSKPVARVSPQPQSISPPVQQTPVVSVVEEKAKSRDKIEAKTPEADRWTPLKSPPPISSIVTPTVATTTMTSANSTVTNVTPTKTSVATTATTPTLKSSPTTKNFPPASCPAQLAKASGTPLVTEHSVTSSALSTSDTAVTTDGEAVTAVKKKKKKHHSTTEHSGQEDGVGVEHKKKKKKKKKEHKEHDPNEEPKKKKKKIKHASKERVWTEKEAMPVTAAVKSPLKSPPPPLPVSPTVPTSSSHDLKDNKIDEKLPEETVKQEPTPVPCKREPSLPRESPAISQSIKKAKVEIENKLRPFLLSYYSSSGSDCSSPTMEDIELDDVQKPLPAPTAASTTVNDDVFTKEQTTKASTSAVTTTSNTVDSKPSTTTTSSMMSTQWLGTSPILANVKSTNTVDHHQKSSSFRQNYSAIKQNDGNASIHWSNSFNNKLPHPDKLDNSTVGKHKATTDGRYGSHYGQSKSKIEQDVSLEKQKHTSTKKKRVDSVSDTSFNQKSSSRDGHRGKHKDSTTEHISRRNSQRSDSSSDQQEHNYSKSGCSRDAGRRTSSSDYGDDCSDNSGSHRRERHGSNSSRHQSRRERHGSSSSRQSDDRRDGSSTGRDNSSSDRQGVRWDGSRWDRQQPSEVVKHLTSQQQYELGDKVRSWSGEVNTVDSSVAVGSKRRHDDWDREYDAGHVKKVRRHTTEESFDNTRNPFQDYQSKKHFNKRDNNYSRYYDRYEQHRGYRWRYQQYNTSYRRRSDTDNRNFYRH